MLPIVRTEMVWVIKSVGVGEGVVDAVVAGDCIKTS